MARRIPKERREELEDDVASAAAGAWPALDRILRNAGYLVYDPLVVSVADAAAILGVTTEALRQWRLRDGAPQRDDRKYHLPSLISWYRRFLVDRERKDADDESGEKAIKKEIAQEDLRAKVRRRQIDERRLVDVKEIQGQFAVIGDTFRKQLEAIEKAHGKQVGRDLRKMLDRAERAWIKHTKAALND